jgi:FtsZ-interacting cell division protein ZipA
MAGVILMIVGAIGLLVSLFYAAMWSDRRRAAASAPLVSEREYR